MWYTGSNGNKREIGYAFSSDLINFTRSSDNPIIKWNAINEEDIGVEHPYVIKNISFGGYSYKMWFSNAGKDLGTFELFYSTSNNGINWTGITKLSVLPETTEWDSNGKSMSAPSVIYNSDTQSYQLWYVAKGPYNNSTVWRIGYAESQDGINWVKNPSPVLVPDQSWEGYVVANPHIIRDNSGIYYMFYYGANDIGYATSYDGINWDKGLNNILLSPTANAFDNYRLLHPYLIKQNTLDQYYLFYTGGPTSNNRDWQIGLATSDSLPPPFPTATGRPSRTPTPTTTVTPTVPETTTTPTITPTVTLTPTTTVTPTLTSTPTITQTPTTTPTKSPTPTITVTVTITVTKTPTPTPTTGTKPFSPIVILPGLGASWNAKDIFSCDLGSSASWKMAPYVNQYSRLINTLSQNAKLKEGRDFYLYTYDWRQPLDRQGELFKKYLDDILKNKQAETKVRLIGHSLGGLVIRSFLANFPNDDRVEKILTAGTPHEGTVLAYPLWEKGEVWSDDRLMQIAISQIINYCRIRLISFPPKTSRQILQSMVPSVKTLLPINKFLKKNDVLYPISSPGNVNDWLPNHPFSNNVTSMLNTLSGNNNRTLQYLKVTPATGTDKTNGDWTDGKPAGKEYTKSGDGTVLGISSQVIGASNETINGNHGEIVYSDEAITRIMQFLDLPKVSPAKAISVPEETSQKLLTISLDQPAKMQLTDPKNKKGITEEENIIVSYNPEIGLYKLSILPNISENAYLNISQTDGINSESKTYKINLRKNKVAEYLLVYLPSQTTVPKLIPL